MGISLQDYEMMKSRVEKRAASQPGLEEIDQRVNREADLQMQILKFLRERRWAFVWSPMGNATTTSAGTPDFIIAAPNSRTIWLECKTKTGKCSREQLGFKMLLEAQGHEYHVVRSFLEFARVVQETKL